MELNGKMRSYLRKLAQNMDPVVMIGKNGVSGELIRAADEAFHKHELIKVRFADFKDEVDELTNVLAEKTGSSIVGIRGHTAVMYRQNDNPQERKIMFKERGGVIG